MNIIFTGGGSHKGAFIVAKLEEAGHNVFTFGKGCRDCPSDFSFLADGPLDRAKRGLLQKFDGLPDVIIHNARTTSGNLNHALYCNINARIQLDQWAVRMLEGTDHHLRSIHITGWSPKWGFESYATLVSDGAQLHLPLALVAYREQLLGEAHKQAALHEHRLGLASRAEDVRQEEWEKLEEETFQAHKKLSKEYKKRPFPRKEFPELVPPWVPNISAASIVVDRSSRQKNTTSPEDMLNAIQRVLDWEHTDKNRFAIENL